MYNLEAINNICHRIAKKVAEASLLEEENKGEEHILYEKIFNAIKEVLNIFETQTINNINELLEL